MIDMNTMDCAAGISNQRAAVVTVAAKDMRNTSVILGNLLIRAQEKMAATSNTLSLAIDRCMSRSALASTHVLCCNVSVIPKVWNEDR